MLPQKLPLDLMQTVWAQEINPILACPLTKGRLIQSVALASGVTVVNHKLGRKLVGWLVTGIDGVANIYDNQKTNQMPELTLSLTSDAAVTVNLWVF